MRESLKAIVESLLFVAGEPLTPRRLQDVLDLREPAVLREILTELAEDYERRGGGFYLDEVAGGFQLRTRPEYRDSVRRLLSAGGARLSKAALETLAIVAYRQPVMRSDIDHVRGVDSGGVLRALLERKLIRVLGRKEIPGRPLIYGTTRQFLEVFGLRDLKDLPTLKEIAAMGEADGTNPEDAAENEDSGNEIAETPEGGPEAPTGEDDADGTENGEAELPAPDDGEPAAETEECVPPSPSGCAADGDADNGAPEPASDAGEEKPESPDRDLGESEETEAPPADESHGKNA